MRIGVPCNKNRVFPVGIDLQGVHCKPYRVWVCSDVKTGWKFKFQKSAWIQMLSDIYNDTY